MWALFVCFLSHGLHFPSFRHWASYDKNTTLGFYFYGSRQNKDSKLMKIYLVGPLLCLTKKRLTILKVTKIR